MAIYMHYALVIESIFLNLLYQLSNSNHLLLYQLNRIIYNLYSMTLISILLNKNYIIIIIYFFKFLLVMLSLVVKTESYLWIKWIFIFMNDRHA